MGPLEESYVIGASPLKEYWSLSPVLGCFPAATKMKLYPPHLWLWCTMLVTTGPLKLWVKINLSSFYVDFSQVILSQWPKANTLTNAGMVFMRVHGGGGDTDGGHLESGWSVMRKQFHFIWEVTGELGIKPDVPCVQSTCSTTQHMPTWQLLPNAPLVCQLHHGVRATLILSQTLHCLL